MAEPISFELRVVDPRTLKPNPRNPRRMGREGMVKLERAIRSFGFTTPALVQASSGVLMVGHQRTTAAINVGLAEIPVLFCDVDDALAERIMLADNRLGEEAEWDSDRLAELFAEMGGEAAALAGFTEGEFDAVLEAWRTQIDAAVRPRRTVVDWSALGLFYHLGDLGQLDTAPGLGQAVTYLDLLGSPAPMRGAVHVERPAPLALLAGNAAGVAAEGPLWTNNAAGFVHAALQWDAEVVEAPGIPLSPSALGELGIDRAEALERSAEAAVGLARMRDSQMAQLWALPAEPADRAWMLRRTKPFRATGDLLGVPAGTDPGALTAAVTAVLRAARGARVHLCGVSTPALAAAGIAAGATSLDSGVAAGAGWNQIALPARKIDGEFGVRRMRFEELLSVELMPTGRLRSGLAVANWITAALMFEASVAVALGATMEVDA